MTQTRKKTIIAVVVVIALGGWALYQQRLRAAVKDYEQIIEMMDAEDHEGAAAKWDAFLDTAPSRYHDDARRELVRCCLAIGNNPARPSKVRAKWFAKAKSLDPGALDERQQQVLDTFGG